MIVLFFFELRIEERVFIVVFFCIGFVWMCINLFLVMLFVDGIFKILFLLGFEFNGLRFEGEGIVDVVFWLEVILVFIFFVVCYVFEFCNKF